MALPDLSFENEAIAAGARQVAGVDEVGRGPLAGPVVAAAVILGPDAPRGLNDSKALKANERERLCAATLATCRVAVASVSAATIDAMNIRVASLLAMRRAVMSLPLTPDLALVDGNVPPPDLPCPSRCIVGGDARSRSVAAASIVAKVLRDRLMTRWDRVEPGYGFASHKGYGTKAHRDAIARLGPCALHRLSFAPLRARK